MSKLTKSKEEVYARANTINVLVTQFGVKEHEIKHLPLSQLKWMLNTRRYEADKVDELKGFEDGKSPFAPREYPGWTEGK